MPRVNLKPGDSGTFPVTFQGETWQQFVTIQNDGMLTLTDTGCSAYIKDAATGQPICKVRFDSTPTTTPVVGGRSYDCEVTGNGSIAYSFV